MKKAHIITHTHWDREWRYPLWENRMYLCNMIDELLHILDTQSEYKSFVMDGQTVIIEDYLEVRPENVDKIKRYIKEGRIEVGPWYTLPDLYPVCGESLVRNLLKGKRLAQKLGKCTNVAYESFGWGQTSQFPQIYKQFGLDVCIVSKNVSKERAPQCEFMWEAPDGTKMLATRLGEHARANFFMNAYLKIMTGLDYNSDEYEFNWEKHGFVYHRADNNGCWNDFHKLNHDEKIHNEYIKDAVDIAINAMKESVLIEDITLFDGSDSTTSQPYLTELINKINDLYPDIKFEHSTLIDYINLMQEKIDTSKLTVVKGELRDGPTYKCSANALATRPRIKQLNKKVENTLFKMAEPLKFMSGIKEDSFFELAEKFLLLAHPHDSINGVTQDKTVADTMNNLNQALEISEVLCDRACQAIVKNIDMTDYDEKDVAITIFNTLPFKRNEVVRLFIDMPQTKNVWDFDIVDYKGNKLVKQLISRKEVKLPVSSLHSRPYPYFTDRFEVLIKIDHIPAMGYKVFKVVKTQEFNRKTVFWNDIRMSECKEISKSLNTMENEFLKVTVNSDATISILDKKLKKMYNRLNYFEDTGDIGDYWIYYPPYKNKTFTSIGQNAEIWVEENGEVSATIGAKISLELPKYSTKDGRANELAILPIEIYYTLNKDENKVNVKLKLNNTVYDHRLRVMFDTEIEAEVIESAGHFGVDTRPVVKDEKHYPEMQTLPMGYFVKRNEFGIVHNAFCEYEAMSNDEGTVAITLFRAVKNIICTEFRSAGAFLHEDGGQSLGEHIYDYAITINNNDIFKTAESFNAPIKAVQISKGDGKDLPLEKSYLEIEYVIVSAVKKASDSNDTIIRFFNPTDETKTVDLKGIEVNLNEEEMEQFNGNVEKNKIVSVKI